MTTQIFPPFSWSTVPVYWHAANISVPLNDAVVAFVATKGICQRDDREGPRMDNTTTFAEDRIQSAARQLKAANASLAVIAYFNTLFNWPFYRLAKDMAADPSKVLLNIAGVPLLLPGEDTSA